MDWKDRETRLRVAFALLAPAPLVFGLRAAWTLLEWPGTGFPILAMIVGILSGIGMLTALWATWKGPEFWRVVVAMVVAMTGHYVVDHFIAGGLGAAMVYLGTGFLASLRRRAAAYAGIVAGLGAILRATPEAALGQGLLAVGAITLAAFLLAAAWPQDLEKTQ